jgi:hypothetical protein
MSDDLDLSELGYYQVAGYFSDKALAIEERFPNLMTPLLYAAKAVMALEKLNARKSFSPVHLEQWRRNCTWLPYCRGVLTEEIAKLDADHQDMKSDLHKEVVKSLVQQGMRSSNEKINAQMRQNREFRKLDRHLSELRAILAHVLDHCDQFKLIKDVLVQESTLTKHMMAH